MLSFRELETAAYCPRKLYYRRRRAGDAQSPMAVANARDLAYRYPTLLAADGALEELPIAVTPTQFRSNLGTAKARLDAWEALCDPPNRNVLIAGETARGLVHKRLADSLSIVFAGRPPDQGVWHPQSVRLVAAARALEAGAASSVGRVYAEYPAHGVIRAVDVDRRRVGAYRAAVRTARAIDGPPARTASRSKCGACGYRERCGVRTRSALRLLGD